MNNAKQLNPNIDNDDNEVFQHITIEMDQVETEVNNKAKGETEQKNWLSLPFAMLTSLVWGEKREDDDSLCEFKPET